MAELAGLAKLWHHNWFHDKTVAGAPDCCWRPLICHPGTKSITLFHQSQFSSHQSPGRVSEIPGPIHYPYLDVDIKTSERMLCPVSTSHTFSLKLLSLHTPTRTLFRQRALGTSGRRPRRPKLNWRKDWGIHSIWRCHSDWMTGLTSAILPFVEFADHHSCQLPIPSPPLPSSSLLDPPTPAKCYQCTIYIAKFVIPPFPWT